MHTSIYLPPNLYSCSYVILRRDCRRQIELIKLLAIAILSLSTSFFFCCTYFIHAPVYSNWLCIFALLVRISRVCVCCAVTFIFISIFSYRACVHADLFVWEFSLRKNEIQQNFIIKMNDFAIDSIFIMMTAFYAYSLWHWKSFKTANFHLQLYRFSRKRWNEERRTINLSL